MNRMVLGLTAIALSIFATAATAQQRVEVNTAAQCRAISGTLRVEGNDRLVCIVGAPARPASAPRTEAPAPVEFAPLLFVPWSTGSQVFYAGSRVYREGGPEAYERAVEASRNLCLRDGYRPRTSVAGRDYPSIGYRDRRQGRDGFDIRADDILRMGTARSREAEAEGREMTRQFCRDFERFDRRR